MRGTTDTEGKGEKRVKESGRNPLTSAVFIPLLYTVSLCLSLSRSRSPPLAHPHPLTSPLLPSERAPTGTIDRSLPIPVRDADPAESREIIMREKEERWEGSLGVMANTCVWSVTTRFECWNVYIGDNRRPPSRPSLTAYPSIFFSTVTRIIVPLFTENLPGLVGKFRKLFYRYSSSATILLAIFRDGKMALSSRHTRFE